MARRQRWIWGLAAALSLAGCSVSKLGQRAMARQAGRQGLVEGVAQVGPARVRYFAGGQGDPVLLLHGFGGDGLSTWRSQLRDLADGHQLVVPDLLWFGGSASDEAPGLPAQASAMLGLLDALGIERAHVVGISYGGFVALQMAVAAPSRVRSLALVDSPGPVFTPEDEAALLVRFGVPSAEALMLPERWQDTSRLIELSYHRDPWVPGPVLKDMHAHMIAVHRQEQAALLADLPAHREAMTTVQPGALPPTLLIWGRYDEVFPLETGERLSAALGAPLVVIDQTAHAPNLERPDAFNQELLRWLRR